MPVLEDAHPVLGLDAFVAVPDHVVLKGVDELVDAPVVVVLVVEALGLWSAIDLYALFSPRCICSCGLIK